MHKLSSWDDDSIVLSVYWNKTFQLEAMADGRTRIIESVKNFKIWVEIDEHGRNWLIRILRLIVRESEMQGFLSKHSDNI